MAHTGSEYIAYTPTQRLLQKQGVGRRSIQVQNKFLKRWAVWIACATLLALFYVWSRVQVVQIGYDVSKIKGEAQELQKQVSMLEMDLARLKSPARLEEVAKKELNMQHPAAEQIVLVKPDETNR